jgi:hypothetical protein
MQNAICWMKMALFAHGLWENFKNRDDNSQTNSGYVDMARKHLNNFKRWSWLRARTCSRLNRNVHQIWETGTKEDLISWTALCWGRFHKTYICRSQRSLIRVLPRRLVVSPVDSPVCGHETMNQAFPWIQFTEIGEAFPPQIQSWSRFSLTRK